ncbi:MAG: CcmD family protein [Coriobacteriales bacterium]|nr:CcmD family protein [Coriobacteriales bacterium]
MDPVLQEIYKTVFSGAPYVLAAYIAILVGLFAYVTFMLLRVTKLEKQVDLLQSTIERRSAKS